MITHVSRLADPNTGDLAAAPALYLDLPGRRYDLLDPDIPLGGPVLVGGGGVFHPLFAPVLQRLLAGPGPVVGWGVGTNRHGFQPWHTPVDVSKFALLGLRDRRAGFEFAPCVSCLHAAFDAAPAPDLPVVGYAHAKAPLPDLGGAPAATTHDGLSAAAVIAHLARGARVVTTSYHGWYWATLLGRPVTVWKPWSTKFFHTPWPPAFASRRNELAWGGPAYPHALAEARAATHAFHAKARKVLGCPT